MNGSIQLRSLLAEKNPREHALSLFAWLNLGVIEALATGMMTPSDAVRRLYHAENCLFVRRELTSKRADRIMSHGVQLPDLYDAFPVEEAQREFHRELETMRSLCLQLLEKEHASV